MNTRKGGVDVKVTGRRGGQILTRKSLYRRSRRVRKRKWRELIEAEYKERRRERWQH